jgi:hypothetical protein
MHNCKTTKERVAELLLSGATDKPADLVECEDCGNDYDSLKEILRITNRQLEVVTPSKEYWNGYHVRLKKRLEDETRFGKAQAGTPAIPASALSASAHPASRTFFGRVFTSSIRVPMPIAAALLLMFALSLLFASRVSKKETSAPSVSVIHVPVEVPVIQEKVVTKVIYREPKRKRVSTQSAEESTLATTAKLTPASLIGFKPLDEVRLTVIKGGSPDEK